MMTTRRYIIVIHIFYSCIYALSIHISTSVFFFFLVTVILAQVTIAFFFIAPKFLCAGGNDYKSNISSRSFLVSSCVKLILKQSRLSFCL